MAEVAEALRAFVEETVYLLRRYQRAWKPRR